MEKHDGGNMIIDYKPSDKKSRVLIVKELLAGASLGLLYPFGFGKSDRRTARRKDQRTVVMMHGYMGNRSTLYPMAAYLRFRGIKNILFYDYSSNQGVEQAAIHFRKYLKKHVKGGRVDLVCHSMGGVIARAYIQLLGGGRRIDRCVTLGTPHKGTYNAYWMPTRVGTDLRPDSKLFQRLEKFQECRADVQTFSIVGGSDNIVLPRVFGSHEKTIVVPDTGHLGMLVSKRVMAEVVKCLVPNRCDEQTVT